ncbi:MAG: hypothetical protein JOZ54_05735 [Acidobacteria bacterium]|nr:hypothetical protein [Acidobacteriota bacterium]
MRRVYALVALLLASLVTAAPLAKKTAIATENGASCDISTSPAATLLLPRFEVDVDKPANEGINTIFSVINTSRSPQIARITLWTDQGYPTLWFNVFLTGYDVQPISLRDILVLGLIPDTGTKAVSGPKSGPNDSNPKLVNTEGCLEGNVNVPASFIADIRSMLTAGTSKTKECRVGTAHDKAIGYVTIDLVNSCSLLSPLDMSYYSQLLLFDNVLTGDFELINPDANLGNYAGGNPLVHLKAIPEGGTAQSAATPLPYTFYDRYTPPGARRVDRRQPLPSVFAARFIQGGTTAFATDYVIWREGTVAAGECVAALNAELPVTSIVRFDEDENPTMNAPAAAQTMPLAASLSTTSPFFPPMAGLGVSGWMFLNLDSRVGAQEKTPFSSSRPSQNWVLVSMRAEGRYGVAYDATAMANGCTSSAAVAKTPGGLQ